MSCIFCKIISGEIKTEAIFETPNVIAFNDINPIAPAHALIVPKHHYETMNDIPATDTVTMRDIFTAAQQIAKIKGIDQSGYRLIANVNRDGGQEVPHLHFHIIGGRQMGLMG